MWTCTFASLHPRCLGILLLSLLLLLMSPSAVRAVGENEATTPNCVRTGLEPQPVTVQLRLVNGQVVATLHSPPGALPTAGCRVPLQFQIPENHRPRYAVWRDVEGRAVRIDGTPDPTHPDPLPLRLWIHPDGVLNYEVREAGTQAMHASLNLAVAWGTTLEANDLTVLDILGTALEPGREPSFFDRGQAQELGARLHGGGRVTELDWHATHPDEYWEGSIPRFMAPPTKRSKVGIHPPGVRATWHLPSELGQLTALSRLALGGPLLTGTIPPELGQLANLEQLTLAGSRLTGAVPPELGQLTKLWRLELHDNQLTSLPPELGRLTKLVGLGVAGNRLTTLPPELGRLRQLKFLDVQDNQLTSLPPLAGFDQLYYLDLSGNLLTTLPTGLAQLVHLGELDMSDNRLTALAPESLVEPFTVASMTTLDLSGNLLTTLPPELGRLRLERLDLSDNRLTTLPPELGQLRPATRSLLFFHLGFKTLTLDLSGNRLTDLPAQLGRLSHLVHLDLSDNRLTDLPPELGQLTQLLTLDLSGNRLTVLPAELGQLSQLDSLDLRGNPLTTCPLPLPGQADRYIFPPDYEYHVDFDHWYLSPPPSTEYPGLPFLDLCLE